MIESYIGASLGMTLGMLIGIAIGKSMDSKAEIYGNSLKTTL
jgi:F0F1-type ATP synthase membrane subunit c/vacuolar-type H+-ATPase subunit K